MADNKELPRAKGWKAGEWPYRVIRERKISYYLDESSAISDAKRNNSAKFQKFNRDNFTWETVEVGNVGSD